MKVLIIGYGKMGREIESMLLSKGHEIAGIVDNESERDGFSGFADVAIEFSIPDACIDNFYWCFERQLPVVTGTTGWLKKLDEVTLKCKEKNGAMIWGSNFSPGMNIFFLLNRTLSMVTNLFPQYSPQISETHHIHKLDKPSGTALTLADEIIKNNQNIKEWIMDVQPVSSSQMPVIVTREGEVKGIHEVQYSCNDDVISIKHEALSRQGFASGAILAAEWIPDKKGVYSFTEYFETLIKK